MEKLKIATWNINQRSGKEVNSIPNFVVQKIINGDFDIVILTEFSQVSNSDDGFLHSKFNKKMSEKYYTKTNSEKNTDANKVLIAVKNSLLVNGNKVTLCDDEFENESKGSYPNFLHVDLTIDDKKIAIIGTRILPGNGFKADYLNRKEQVENLLCHIGHIDKTVDGVILAGDFNNSIVKGGLDEKYEEVKEKYHYNSRGETSPMYETYNYHILKDLFCKIGCVVATPTDSKQFSWVDKNGYKYKQDHIFFKGLTVSNPTYSWDFMCCEHDCTCEKKPYHTNFSPNPPYPDHAMLIVEALLSENKGTTVYICPNCGNVITEMGTYSIPSVCDECSGQD